MKKIVALFLVLHPSAVFAFNLTDVVANMENSERQISSMRFDYEQKIHFETMDADSTVRGRADFAKGGRFHIVKKEPQEQIMVSDGKTLSVYTPSFKQMWRGSWISWEKASMLPKGFIPMNDFTADLKKNFNLQLVETKTAEGPVKISATPKNSNAGYKLILTVSPEKWIVEAVRFVSETAQIDTTFTHFEINPEQEASLFTMNVPKGVEVIPLN